MRYIPVHDPEDNPDYPWKVRDGLDPSDFQGPCWNARDAAIVAWALSHQRELLAQRQDLRELVDRCVETRL